MAKIKAFKAIRPTRDKAHLVATRPVYTYKKNILKAKLEENPFTFIRIIHPEFQSSIKTKPNSKERFKHVKEQFDVFCENGILIQDQEESIYLYRQTKDNHAYLGVIAGASVDEYKQDLIKKHEATLTSREEMFTNYLDIVGFNAEPVLLSYPHQPNIAALLSDFTQARPEYEFSTTDMVKHELWVLNSSESKMVQNAFEQIEATYIADGHHRSASSTRLFDRIEQRGSNQNGTNHAYFLAFLIDESLLQIVEFNRLVHSLNGKNSETLIQELRASFDIEILPHACQPTKQHEIHMNLRGSWYKLTCKTHIINENDPVACLDPEILTQFILTPLLGIKDLKTDANIEFVAGVLGLNAISDPISSGKAEVGFVLHPVTMDQVKAVADNQLIMPPKSTWVEPKLRSGLTIYSIEE